MEEFDYQHLNLKFKGGVIIPSSHNSQFDDYSETEIG